MPTEPNPHPTSPPVQPHPTERPAVPKEVVAQSTIQPAHRPPAEEKHHPMLETARIQKEKEAATPDLPPAGLPSAETNMGEPSGSGVPGAHPTDRAGRPMPTAPLDSHAHAEVAPVVASPAVKAKLQEGDRDLYSTVTVKNNGGSAWNGSDYWDKDHPMPGNATSFIAAGGTGVVSWKKWLDFERDYNQPGGTYHIGPFELVKK